MARDFEAELAKIDERRKKIIEQRDAYYERLYRPIGEAAADVFGDEVLKLDGRKRDLTAFFKTLKAQEKSKVIEAVAQPQPVAQTNVELEQPNVHQIQQPVEREMYSE